MQKIRIADVNATLSSVVDQAHDDQPVLIIRHGKPAAVALSFEDWRRLGQVPSFGRLLASSPLRSDDLYERDMTPLRKIDLDPDGDLPA